MWYLLITVIALCYGFPYNDHHELSCKENIEHVEVGPQGSKSPYALSIEKENTHVLLGENNYSNLFNKIVDQFYLL